jgi:hypothetical protein
MIHFISLSLSLFQYSSAVLSQLSEVASSYDPRALTQDLKKLNKMEERLREQYRSSQARLKREKDEAVSIVNG